jgi:hypothetical protein
MDHVGQGLARHRFRLRLIGLVAVLAIAAAGVLWRYVWTEAAVDGGNLGKLARIVGNHRLTRAGFRLGLRIRRARLIHPLVGSFHGLVCVIARRRPRGSQLAVWKSLPATFVSAV